MKRQSRHSKQLALLTLLAFLLSGLPMAVATPQPVMAQSPDAINEDEPADDEIVYIDEDGYIQVLDPYQIPGNREIMWVSPDDGWRDAALGDFNGDGDMEIVAIGDGSDDDNDDDGKLVIYDPVVSTGSTVGLPSINGIHWEKLYERRIDGKPTLIAGGNFDDNIDADEILFGFLMQDEAKLPDKPDEIFRITVIKNANQVPDGRAWTDHIPRKDDGNEWSYVTVGNVDRQGTDEFALVDEDGGELNIFRINDGFERFWGDSSSSDPYRGVTFGDIYNDANLQIPVSRNLKSRPNLFLYRYNPETDDLDLELPDSSLRFVPYPRYLWVADVNGSGDDELFFLRREQDPRLVGVNRGADGTIELEDDLDSDEFRVGVGGDFDADGKDEIAIASDEEVYLYPELDRSMDRDEYNQITTNRRTLRAGDLDAEGSLPGPAFALRRTGGNEENVETIFETLESGLQGPIRGYEVHNIGSPATFFFTYAVAGAPDWLEVSANSNTVSDVAPAPIFLQFDARDLLPGVYTSALTFSSNDPDVLNSPHTVPIKYTVEAAAIEPNPETVLAVYYPCADPLESRQTVIEITGSPDVVYNAVIMDVPIVEAALAELTADLVSTSINDEGVMVFEDANGVRSTMDLPADPRQLSAGAVSDITWPTYSPWVTATSADGIVPDIMTLAIDPAQRRTDNDEAVLLIVADKSAGSAPANVRIVPIQIMCAQELNNLPVVLR